MSTANGVASDTDAALDPLAHIRDELEEALRPLRERKAELQVALMQVSSDEERIVNALLALGGQKPERSEPVRRRTRREASATGANTGKNWMPSAEKIERVYLALRQAGPEPVGNAALAGLTGYSRETVNRAMRALREQQRARLVGVAGQGNMHMYALMPESDDGA
jgi:CRP-like cAMP-binding protein